MKPDFAIINEQRVDSFAVLTIDTTHATYQGVKWLAMGDFGKRKFENYLFMSRLPERIKCLYV